MAQHFSLAACDVVGFDLDHTLCRYNLPESAPVSGARRQLHGGRGQSRLRAPRVRRAPPSASRAEVRGPVARSRAAGALGRDRPPWAAARRTRERQVVPGRVGERLLGQRKGGIGELRCLPRFWP